MAYLIKNGVVVEESEMVKMLQERGYGVLDRENRLILSPLEALYLLENGRIEIFSPDEERIEFGKLMRIFAKKDENIDIKYAVYSDLRSKGYVVRTGYGYASLRLYEKGIRPNEGKSSALIEVFSEREKIGMLELNRMIQLSRIVKKDLIIAVVSDLKKIKYMKVKLAEL
ncbi:MAG: tRNA-intron lyase [Candidatus Micrarchaeota archaeon]|nr:tRNA-intron lyase [Candidatus Micrarchaeota archaeon]